MAIQTVGIGAAPNDNTGDTPRTGIAKLNANFTDPTNAASRLVQTSPSDATAGRVLTTDSTHTAAGVLYTAANYQPASPFGIGVVRFMKNTGAQIPLGGIVSGSQLDTYDIDASGNFLIDSVQIIPGSWVNVRGAAISTNIGSLMARIA